MDEEFAGQASGQDLRSSSGRQSPIGLPSEYVGAPPPPRQLRAFGVTYGCYTRALARHRDDEIVDEPG